MFISMLRFIMNRKFVCTKMTCTINWNSVRVKRICRAMIAAYRQFRRTRKIRYAIEFSGKHMDEFVASPSKRFLYFIWMRKKDLHNEIWRSQGDTTAALSTEWITHLLANEKMCKEHIFSLKIPANHRNVHVFLRTQNSSAISIWFTGILKWMGKYSTDSMGFLLTFAPKIAKGSSNMRLFELFTKGGFRGLMT